MHRLHEQRHDITNRHLAEIIFILYEETMNKLDQLQAAVAAEDTVIQSAIVLINGIADRIAEAGVDQAALDALVADVQSQAASLGAAVTANTGS